MNKTTVLCLVFAALFALAGCGGSSRVMKATAFSGGALSAFAGDDGGAADAKQVARNVMDLRTFDFVTDSFRIANGAVSSSGLGGGSFGQGTGTLILGAERAAVLLYIDSSDPAISNVQLSGDFNVTLAQRAIDSPGASFSATWRLSFRKDNRDRVLNFMQELTGAQFSQVP
jgi:hypothetical protein